MKRTMTVFVFCALGSIVYADDKPNSSSVTESELRNELLSRTGPDQDSRKAMIRWTREHGSNGVVDTTVLSPEENAHYEKLRGNVREIDSANTAWLKAVVEKHGWPTIALVGKDGAGAAWLLVQHADRDPKFQRQCLDRMASHPKDEVSQSNFAYLTDRVLLAEGKRQLYGTQCQSIDGKLKPKPIEDEANVDQRRSEVGLMPLAEYLRLAEQILSGSIDAK